MSSVGVIYCAEIICSDGCTRGGDGRVALFCTRLCSSTLDKSRSVRRATLFCWVFHVFVAGGGISSVDTRRQGMYGAGSDLLVTLVGRVLLRFALAGLCCSRNVLGCWDAEGWARGVEMARRSDCRARVVRSCLRRLGQPRAFCGAPGRSGRCPWTAQDRGAANSEVLNFLRPL